MRTDPPTEKREGIDANLNTIKEEESQISETLVEVCTPFKFHLVR